MFIHINISISIFTLITEQLNVSIKGSISAAKTQN